MIGSVWCVTEVVVPKLLMLKVFERSFTDDAAGAWIIELRILLADLSFVCELVGFAGVDNIDPKENENPLFDEAIKIRAVYQKIR